LIYVSDGFISANTIQSFIQRSICLQAYHFNGIERFFSLVFQEIVYAGKNLIATVDTR